MTDISTKAQAIVPASRKLGQGVRRQAQFGQNRVGLLAQQRGWLTQEFRGRALEPRGWPGLAHVAGVRMVGFNNQIVGRNLRGRSRRRPCD